MGQLRFPELVSWKIFAAELEGRQEQLLFGYTVTIPSHRPSQLTEISGCLQPQAHHVTAIGDTALPLHGSHL